MNHYAIELWPHQLASIEAVILAIEAGLKHGLIVLPTGVGKTGMALSLARRLNWDVLFLVHRDRLVTQTVNAAARFWPEATVGVIQAERDEWGPDLFGSAPKLVVAAVQSLHERRLLAMPRRRFGLVIADEAHHAPSPSWARILDHFEARFRLGITATPQRLDKKGLAGWFGQEALYSYSIHRAIEEEFLARVDSRSVPTQVDLSSVEGRRDLSPEALAKLVNTPSRNAQVVEAYQEFAAPRRAIAFCVDVSHCEALAQRFANAGLRSAAVHSKSLEDQDEVLDAFAAGRLDVVCSCEVLTEGFDDPGVSCILMARPTMSRSLYIQMVGRGLRKAPGKRDCLVIDFTDNHAKHKLACSLDLFGRKGQGGAAATPDYRDADTPPAVQPDLPVVSWQLAESCPWPALPSLTEYLPLFPWDEEPATDGQVRYLTGFGVKVGGSLTKGEACYLIDRCKEFEATFPRPATEAQQRYLERAGLWQEGMGRRQASVLIGNLKRRGSHARTA